MYHGVYLNNVQWNFCQCHV